MTETSAKPVPLKAAPDPEGDGKDGGGKTPLDRAWDVTAILAGVVLGIILFDIVWPSHPVTKLLSRKRRGGGEADGKPCEDC